MADVLRFDIAKDPKGNPITYGRVGDTDGLTRSVKVFEDGKPLDLTGYVITFEGNTSKYRTKVFDTGGVELVDATKGEFTYTFPNMAFAVEGQYERAYFSFASAERRMTTGDFEIIVFGNSDIDAAEAETIITEYNRLVAELHALQEQAIDDMNGKFEDLETDISNLGNQLIDIQNEIDRVFEEFKSGNFWTKEESFNKEESSANVIYQIIGKEKVRMDFTLNFDKKVISSNVENPNWSGAAYGTNQLPDRSDFKNILSPQSRMDSLKSLDRNNVTVVTVAGTPQYPCVEIKWDVVETLTRFLGESFFADRGAVDVASKANVAKQIINNAISSNIWGYGTSPNGNDFRTANFVTGTGWQLGSVPPNNSNVVKKLSAINSSDATIQSDGNIYTIAYASQSTADNQSSIYVDYATLTFSIEVSMNEHIKSMIATYYVGAIATQSESETGTDNTKTMTPLRTKQQIDKRMATQSEAEVGTADDKLMTPFGTKQNVDKRLASQEEVSLGEDISKLVTPATLAGLKLISLSDINIAVIDGTQGSVNTSTPNMNGKELGFGESVSFISQENVFANVDSSNHRLTVSEEGLYCLLAHVWVQPTGTVNGYWYLNTAINGVRAGGTDRMWGIGNTGWKNRQDGTGIFIKRLNAGDGISVLVETGYADAVNSAGIKSAILIKLA